jgi:hypothetical protein
VGRHRAKAVFAAFQNRMLVMVFRKQTNVKRIFGEEFVVLTLRKPASI